MLDRHVVIDAGRRGHLGQDLVKPTGEVGRRGIEATSSGEFWMLSFAGALKVFVALDFCDMRKWLITDPPLCDMPKVSPIVT